MEDPDEIVSKPRTEDSFIDPSKPKTQDVSLSDNEIEDNIAGEIKKEDSIGEIKKVDNEIGQKKLPNRSSKRDEIFCGSSLLSNCANFKLPLSNLADTRKCEICQLEYICSSCFNEFDIHKCFICILDQQNTQQPLSNDYNDSSEVIDVENVDAIDDAYVTDSEPKRQRISNFDWEDQKLRKSKFFKVIPTVPSSNPAYSSRNNYFKSTPDDVTELSDTEDADPNYSVMMRIGKIGQGNGVISGFQSDINCLRSDPQLRDSEKYMTSTAMDYLSCYETDKLPMSNGRDVVNRLPSWFWQTVSGPDPNYTLFLGGKTLKELRELFNYKITQFDVFDSGHISLVTITNLHNIMSLDYSNLPLKEVVMLSFNIYLYC